MPDGWTLVQPAVRGSASSTDGWTLVQPARARRPVSAEDFIDQAQPEGSALGRFAGGVWESLNPVTLVKGVAHAVTHPIDTATALAAAQVDQFGKAKRAYEEGRGIEALGHAAAGALPLLGPAAAAAGESIAEGDVAGGLGKGVGLLAPLGIAKVAPKALKVPSPLRNRSLAAAEAVALAERAGTPIAAATATGNRFVSAAQHVVDRSLGGSMVAERAAQAEAQGLATLGEQLAAKGHATAMPAEQAGQSLREALTARTRRFSGEADAAYTKLREFEAHPMHAKEVAPGQVVPMPVDLRPFREALAPLYESLSREAQLAPASIMGDKARALTAIDKLMSGERHAPLSTVDAVLGDLKTFARTDEPALRSMGQGAAAAAVKNLDAVVRQTAKEAGAEVLKALETGRAATVSKHQAGTLLQELADEPVRTINRLTAGKDASIGELRALAREVPAEMPKIGRAVLDDMLTKATSEGGFAHGAAIANQWERLGPSTKMTLFRDPAYITDLDRFFRLTRMAADNPNPSGTGRALLTAGEGGMLLTAPWIGVPLELGAAATSKLLHSRAGVKLLTQGLRIPVGSKAAAAAWFADLANAGIHITPPAGSQTPTAVPGR